MVFMKACRQASYEDYAQEGAYVNYKRMKLILHEMKEANTATTPDELYSQLVGEIEGVYKWCEAKIEALTDLALSYAYPYLSKEVQDVLTERGVHPPAAYTEHGLPSQSELREIADALLHETLRFHECRNLNADIIERVLTREKRYTVLPPPLKWQQIHKTFDFQSLKLDEIFYTLSAMYAEARNDRQGEQKAGDQGSQSFDRRSVKYWVHMQDLPFVIARVIQHLPLSTFKDTFPDCQREKLKRMGQTDAEKRERSESLQREMSVEPQQSNPLEGMRRKGSMLLPPGKTKPGEHHRPPEPASNTPYSLGSAIGSVYFDNADFLFYHRRLERLEGSSLFRIRWYGSDKLEDNDPVFMELKVHHEAWTGERSNKRRFTLKNSEVDRYLKGKLSLLPHLRKLREKGRSEKEQAEFKSLACEILTKVKGYDLNPVLRTHYIRAAFQRGSDASIRVSIDTRLRLTSEDFGASKHWRYAGQDEMFVSEVPYAVVEVKIQCAENQKIAPWIEELMQCRYMESVPKFSKYAHGMAVLYGHTPRVRMIPYWVHQIGNDIRSSTKVENSQWDKTAGLVRGKWGHALDRFVFGASTRPAQTTAVGAKEASFLPDSKALYEAYCKLAGKWPMSHLTPSIDRRRIAYGKFGVYDTLKEVEAGCMTHQITEKELLEEEDEENLGFRIGESFIPFQTKKRVRVPQKFDPKTLLAAERQFLKWVMHGLTLGLASLAVIHYGAPFDFISDPSQPFFRRYFHLMVGIVLLLISFWSLFYPLMVYRARTKRMYARDKIRYDDVDGPSTLTVVLVVAIALMGFNRLSNSGAAQGVLAGAMISGS